MFDELDASLKRNAVAEPSPTRRAVDDASPGRGHISTRLFAFGSESEEELLEETLLAWQSQGPAAAWRAMFDILGWWFEARGLDPETQRIDRAHNEIHRAPWSGSRGERGGDA